MAVIKNAVDNITDLKLQVKVFRSLFWVDSVIATTVLLSGNVVMALLLAILGLQLCNIANSKAVLIAINELGVDSDKAS